MFKTLLEKIKKQSGQTHSISGLFESLLNEDSTGSIMRILKLPKQIATHFNEKDSSSSFAAAKFFLMWLEWKKVEIDLPIPEFEDDKAWAMALRGYYDYPTGEGESYNNKISNSKSLQKKIKSMNINTFANDFDAADELMSDVKVSNIKDETLKATMMKFPNGFYWTNLSKLPNTSREKACSLEGSLMQHCGKEEEEYGDMISLRDSFGNPHVTMTYSKAENVVNQMRGKQNDVPHKKYWEYIIKFFEKFKATLDQGEHTDLGKELSLKIGQATGIKECGEPEAMILSREKIPGDLASGRDPSSFDQIQLMHGLHVELEHSSDIITAMEIAMDHLHEDPYYYMKLATIETESFVVDDDTEEEYKELRGQNAEKTGTYDLSKAKLS